jgi:hypothetical protein
LPSKVFNRTVRAVSGIKLHDFNCGLKAYRKDVIKNIEVYGEMHRYIPLLAKWSGRDLLADISPLDILDYLSARGSVDGVTRKNTLTEDGLAASEGIRMIQELRILTGFLGQ